jgi:chemotaxis-related protein WspD
MTNPVPTEPIELLDCWNRIGVTGDQSCDKLAVHIHCRNCELYAAAAQRNLQRPVGPEYRAHWSAVLRQRPPTELGHDSAALVFRIGGEWLALPASMVSSVAPEVAAHKLPHRNSVGLLGVVNVGGKLLPSISLASLLGIDQNHAPQRSGRHTFARLVVLAWEEQLFALPVADLHGIVRYCAAAMTAPAATINKGLLRMLTGVIKEQDMMIGVLDGPLIGHQLTRCLK